MSTFVQGHRHVHHINGLPKPGRQLFQHMSKFDFFTIRPPIYPPAFPNTQVLFSSRFLLGPNLESCYQPALLGVRTNKSVSIAREMG
jgi:hypothetical protein